MSSRENHEILEQRVAQAQADALSARAWLYLLDAHRELVPCESNRRIMTEYFAGEPFTLESLEEAIQNLALKSRLALQTSEEDRAKSLQTIQKITGNIPITAQYQSNTELAAKADELTRRREMEKKSPSELRAIIQAGRPAPAASDDLPAHMTRDYLLGLNKPGEFKSVCERFGVSAVTRRLNQR